MKINLPKEEIELITKDDSETLAARIVMFRMLNSFREEAKVAMIELMKRKQSGDSFDFEAFIENTIKENSIDLKMPTFNNLKRNFMEKSIYNFMKGIVNENDESPDDDDEDDDLKKEKEPTEKDIKKQKDLNTIIETIADILARP